MHLSPSFKISAKQELHNTKENWHSKTRYYGLVEETGRDPFAFQYFTSRGIIF